MIAFREMAADIADCRVHYRYHESDKDNDALFLIHGLGCSSDTYRHIDAAAGIDRYSIYIIDLPGYGNSSAGSGFSFTMEEQASVIDQFISCIPYTRLHLAAHSMGGAIALLLNGDSINRLRSFANLEGNLIPADCGMFSRGIADMQAEVYYKKIFPVQQKQFEKHDQFRLAQTTAECMYGSAVSLVKWSDSGELMHRFRKLKCSKAYFAGSLNEHTPVISELGSIPRIFISGAGHGMMTENPAEFYLKLRDFISAAV